MNKRELNLSKYGISGKRYKELSGFCEQYPEWIEELKYKNSTVKSVAMTGMPTGHYTSDPTGDLAVRRTLLEEKCKLVEQTAIEASADFYSYIIKSVCYETSVDYLIAYEEMPLGKSAFYEIRRYFFCLLDKNKKF